MNPSSNNLANLTRGWTAPAELTASLPRQVTYSASGILALALMFFLMAGGAALAYTLYNQGDRNRERARLLADQGADIGGKVTHLWRRGGGTNVSFHVAYEFEVGGRVLHGETNSPRKFWESLSEGTPVRVRYLPADPSVNRIANVPQDGLPAWVMVLFPLTFIGVSALLIHRMRKQRRLLEDGRPAPGIVTKMRRTKYGRSLAYDFLLPGGRTAKGSGMARRGTAEVGSVITVAYDPDDPASSAPYPFELVKIAR